MAFKKSIDPAEAFFEAEVRIERAYRRGAKSLNLGSLGLTEVPESIGRLTELERLDLYVNQLTTLPESIGMLTSLVQLRLFSNQLRTLPASFTNLISLRHLDLDGNRFTEVPECLRPLSRLVILSLDNNWLTTLPGWIDELTDLKRLRLYGNPLTLLPSSIVHLPQLAFLDLRGNERLGLPDEITAIGGEPLRIFEYYFRLRHGKRPLNEAKLILLGRGEVGKTCLVNRLVHDRFSSTAMTRGIAITQWLVPLAGEPVRLHVWDFGGQEIQHATHQFFLTERSLYLVVLNGRAGAEEEDAEYWLRFVKTFGASSPTIVVLNKFKVQPFQVNRRALSEKYPFICGFLETDCEPDQGNGIPELQHRIVAALGEHLPNVKASFPAEWFRIKERLAEMKEPFISFEDYRAICAELGETDPQAQEQLAGFLNALGIALNFREDQQLRDETVLNPHWVTEAVYQIITSPLLAANRGELRLPDLESILPRETYPERMHGFLIELMRKFELCFPFDDVPGERRYLVPELLDKEEPELKDPFAPVECLNFRYDYRLMPEGLLPRFITRTHTMSEPAERWRTGVVLRWEGCRALVRADKQDRQVVVRVHGELQKRTRLLAVIRENFDQIHAEMRDFKPAEWVALEGLPDEWVSHRELEIFAQKQFTEMPKTVGTDIVSVNVQEILGQTDVPGSRERSAASRMEERRPLKLFISYAHEDEKWRAKLAPNLDLLQREGLVEVWCDLQVKPGEKWSDEIRRKLDEADLYIFLMSTDLLASEYVQETELPVARRRHDAGQAKLVPVVVRRCSWQRYVADIQALPRGGKPVKAWTDKDEACFDVEEGLRTTIDELTKPPHFRSSRPRRLSSA